MYDTRSIECGDKDQESSDSMSLTVRRRRLFQRQACILSVMAAFTLGLVLGVFVPMFSLSTAIFTSDLTNNTVLTNESTMTIISAVTDSRNHVSTIPQIHFPTIYDIQNAEHGANRQNSYAVSFLPEDEKLSAETVFRNAFYLEEHKGTDTMTVKKLDAEDGSIKEFTVQRTADGLFRKSAEVRLSKPSAVEEMLGGTNSGTDNSYTPSVEFVQQGEEQRSETDPLGIIERDIYWGNVVEQALPVGFSKHQTVNWNEYIRNGIITRLEIGCGRMQNRMVVFQDGTRACARYRQNTDQIQGELFSFYLGQLLNITNLAPSAASIIDMNTNTWQLAAADIATAQWKSLKPVVLTKWLPDLEPAGIPLPFQPLERHLNKFDIKNLTRAAAAPSEPIAQAMDLKKPIVSRLIELAQWSDLIIFDYLIANLDRVVNNLYNYQWNADIMAAPAHNLARKKKSQLLVFLDNESGLLHGYRLLKKYEAYHGLLLDNLCVFRRPTIEALQRLRDQGIGQRLHQQFEESTLNSVRDVLPPLPDKSIKILNDRIDRVLGQVQKCRELFSSR